jgi:hypothetical protein
MRLIASVVLSISIAVGWFAILLSVSSGGVTNISPSLVGAKRCTLV